MRDPNISVSFNLKPTMVFNAVYATCSFTDTVSEKEYTLPDFSIKTHGTSFALDLVPITPQCSQAYLSSMESKATNMAVQVNGLIGSDLCQHAKDLFVSGVSVRAFTDVERVMSEALYKYGCIKP